MRPLPATRISPTGRAWLEHFTEARPLHVFDHVCNLINEREVVLSLQSDPVPPSPVSLSIDTTSMFEADQGGFSAWLSRDSAVRVEDGRLLVGPLVVDWVQAVPWDPAPNWNLMRQNLAHWRPRALALIPQLLAEAPDNSLAPLLAQLGSAQAAASGGPLAERILAAARPAADSLQRALEQQEIDGLSAAASKLAGLGGGLTPSGDDYLMGVMHALWASMPEAEAKALSEPMAVAAVPRTGPLSATWLQAAAQGEATGSWHQLLTDLLEGSEADLKETTRRIIRIGHSSGADGLAGFCQTLITI